MKRSQRWSLATALLIVVVIAIGWFGLVAPQHSHKSSYQSQAANVEQQNLVTQSKINRLQEQQKDVVAEQNQILAISKNVPDTVSLAPYVRAISEAALQTGIDLQSIAPLTPVPVKLAAPATTPKPAPNPTADSTAQSAPRQPAAASNNVLAVPLTLQIAGSYAQIQLFLAKIEGLQRVGEVTSVDLKTGGQRTGETQTQDPGTSWKVLKGTIQLDIFMTGAPLPGATATTQAPKPSPSPSPSH